MKRFTEMNLYQRFLFLLMPVLIITFLILDIRTVHRVGYEYDDLILVPTYGDGYTVYYGTSQGKQVKFTVYDYHTVIYNYDNNDPITYTLEFDETAVPKYPITPDMTGVILYKDGKEFFRGGIKAYDHLIWIQKASTYNSGTTNYVYNGTEYGHICSPSYETVLELMYNPELTHKGDGRFWLLGTFACLANMIAILFADECFTLGLIFTIKDPQYAEPTAFERLRWHVAWTSITIVAIMIYIMGLKIPG